MIDGVWIRSFEEKLEEVAVLREVALNFLRDHADQVSEIDNSAARKLGRYSSDLSNGRLLKLCKKIKGYE